MKNSTPAQYHRDSKEWSKYLGKTGIVLQATTIAVAAPNLESFLPYDYLIVEVNGKKKNIKLELMGVCGQHFEVGDAVRLVFKRIAQPLDGQIIPYGIKAALVSDLEK